MNGKWYVTVPVTGVLFQAVPAAFLRVVPAFAYSSGALPDAWERPVSFLGLGGIAVTCLALGTVGLYGALRHTHGVLRAALVFGCCVPSLLCGAVYLHAVLAFLTLV